MKTSIYWFRQDLRLEDNPALSSAADNGEVLPIYILDDINSGDYKMGAASRVWLFHALSYLNESLNGKLRVFCGDAKEILHNITNKRKIEAIYWNRCYEPWRIKRDKAIKKSLEENGIEVNTYNGSLLWEPWENLKDNKEPYKVFTPYYKKAYNTKNPRQPLPLPLNLKLSDLDIGANPIESLNLLPSYRWDKPLINKWNISEKRAAFLLDQFLENGIQNYKEGRNFPATNNNSRLSPYLHFGQISPNQIWHSVRALAGDGNLEHFCSELGWREFSFNLLYYFPDLPNKNLQSKFDQFPWQSNIDLLKKWQQGLTGYPIVDAGMRELWQTGFMHNRVRMIVASFLIKNLLIDWREGERWFWDCLVDADLASNSASWQWVAGCGADAAPYFRIFNPITKGEKFDPMGIYTKKYVPELAKMPDKYLFKPWEAPKHILDAAGVKLGLNYPMPIVDIQSTRIRALEAYASCK
jgi:deoxyribodipyrimidine photo-lyase